MYLVLTVVPGTPANLSPVVSAKDLVICLGPVPSRACAGTASSPVMWPVSADWPGASLVLRPPFLFCQHLLILSLLRLLMCLRLLFYLRLRLYPRLLLYHRLLLLRLLRLLRLTSMLIWTRRISSKLLRNNCPDIETLMIGLLPK